MPRALAFDPDGQRLQIVPQDGRYRIVDARTGVVRQQQNLNLLRKSLTPATVAAFSGDARTFATVCNDDPHAVQSGRQPPESR